MSSQLASGIHVYHTARELAAGRHAEWFFDEMQRLRREAGRPIHVLVDLRGVPASALASRRVVYERHREITDHKIAILGESRFQEFVVTFLMTATGYRAARYFTDEAKAHAWLAEAPR